MPLLWLFLLLATLKVLEEEDPTDTFKNKHRVGENLNKQGSRLDEGGKGLLGPFCAWSWGRSEGVLFQEGQGLLRSSSPPSSVGCPVPSSLMSNLLLFQQVRGCWGEAGETQECFQWRTPDSFQTDPAALVPLPSSETHF